jgi:hypothetical protein
MGSRLRVLPDLPFSEKELCGVILLTYSWTSSKTTFTEGLIRAAVIKLERQ